MNTSWDTLKLVAEPTRLRILALLLREELSVAELQEILDMAQSRISSQLALLRSAELVVDRREGKRAYYSLRNPLPPATLALLRSAAAAVSEQPELATDRAGLVRALARRAPIRRNTSISSPGVWGKTIVRDVRGKPSATSPCGWRRPSSSRI